MYLHVLVLKAHANEPLFTKRKKYYLFWCQPSLHKTNVESMQCIISCKAISFPESVFYFPGRIISKLFLSLSSDSSATYVTLCMISA